MIDPQELEGTWKRRELKDRKRTLNKYPHLTKREDEIQSVADKKKKQKFKDIFIYKIHKTKRRSKDNFRWVEKEQREVVYVNLDSSILSRNQYIIFQMNKSKNS